MAMARANGCPERCSARWERWFSSTRVALVRRWPTSSRSTSRRSASILGGHKQRTRGFVFRAMLKQTRTRDRIPMDQLVDSHRAAKVVARLARPVGEPKPRHPKMTIADRDADPDMLAAYFRSASRIPVPSREQTDELARRIEASEHNLLCALLRSAVLGRELSDLARKLDEGSVSPWDILIGAVPKTATAKQAAHDRLRLLFSNFESSTRSVVPEERSCCHDVCPRAARPSFTRSSRHSGNRWPTSWPRCAHRDRVSTARREDLVRAVGGRAAERLRRSGPPPRLLGVLSSS